MLTQGWTSRLSKLEFALVLPSHLHHMKKPLPEVMASGFFVERVRVGDRCCLWLGNRVTHHLTGVQMLRDWTPGPPSDATA